MPLDDESANGDRCGVDFDRQRIRCFSTRSIWTIKPSWMITRTSDGLADLFQFLDAVDGRTVVFLIVSGGQCLVRH